MDQRFRPEYTYARVLGAVARALLGTRAAAIAKAGRVAEAWKLLFDEQAPALPERLLVAAAERRLETEALQDFLGLAGQVARTEEFFRSLLRKSEFAWAKKASLALREEGKAAPELPRLPVRPSVRASFYPDRARVFGHRRFAWLADAQGRDETEERIRLDCQYYEELWRAASRLPMDLRGGVKRLIRTEAELENVVWALRLRRYYGMRGDEVEPILLSLKGAEVKAAALDALGRAPDSKADWAGWKWESLVNEGSGDEWHLDVRQLEVAARRRVFGELVRSMHMDLGSYAPLYALFRIKEYETAAIFGVIEGIHLEAPAEEISAFATQLTGAYA